MMPAPKPPGPGRPAHQPTAQTRRTAESMAAYGIQQEEIAKVLGIGKSTLHVHYRDELDTATARMITAVAQSLYKQALGERDENGKVILAPSVAACCFILKTRGGWKETTVHEHKGDEDNPVRMITRTVVDPKENDDS